jgi:hypothetical protein
MIEALSRHFDCRRRLYNHANDEEVSSYTSAANKEMPGDHEEIAWMEMQRNVYSAGIASVVQQIGVSDGSQERSIEGRRVARLLTAATVVLLAVSLQVFLVVRVKQLVCAAAVHEVRQLYSDYEKHMYNRTQMTVDGDYRGVGPEFFLPGNFKSLDDDVKRTICQVPLSQPDFLFAILFIWSLTVFAELRKCISWAKRFLVVTDTSSDVHVRTTRPAGSYDEETGRLVPPLPGGGPADAGTNYGLDEGQTGLLALSKTVKVLIGTVFAVEAATAMFLLWIGCRWLVATPDFSNLFLNGLALVFIVQIKDMLYEHVLPQLFQLETEVIRVKRESLSMDYLTIATPIFWTVVSATWVGLYMFCLQRVLPDYRWDVRGPCFEFLSAMLHV